MPRNEGTGCCCNHPDRLKGKPEDCTPEQIAECHGKDERHTCCESRDKKD